MTARARHDRGDRWIDPDADACGVGASIQAVQHSAPARPSSPRPAQQPAPGLIRGAWACADNRETDPNQLPFAADKVHQARHLRIADVVRRPASGANGHDPMLACPRTE